MRAPTIIALVLIVGGCSLGRDYAGPPELGPVGAPAKFSRATASTPSSPPLERWWVAFGDPQLNILIDKALAASPDLEAARARLSQAQARLSFARTKGRPVVSARPAYIHAEIPGLGLDGPDNGDGITSLDVYNLGTIASWELDLFGVHRKTLEDDRAKIQAVDASLADVQVSLTTQVARTYVELRNRQQRLALAHQTVALQEERLVLARQRFAGGATSTAEVDRAELEYADGEAEVVVLDQDIRALLGTLAVLAGQRPGALDLLLKQAGPLPAPPASTPIGEVADLLRRRPDIRAAERRIAASDARIGISRAEGYPKLKLLGIIGVGGASLKELGNGDLTLVGAPTLQWSFLDFGRNRSLVEQAEASRDEAEAVYRMTVLRALEDAERALSELSGARQLLSARERAAQAAAASSSRMEQRFGAGAATRTEVLESQTSFLVSRQSVINAHSALATAYIDLNKALGLGWRAS